MLKVRVRMPKLSMIEPSESVGGPCEVTVVVPPPGSGMVVLVTPPGVRLAPPPIAPRKPLSPPPVMNPLSPNCFSAERLISEKRTSSMTCCEEPIESMFTTLPGA